MSNKPQKTILKVLVGSHAHGLATPESDQDYRSIFLWPTSDLLNIGPKPKITEHSDGGDDCVSYELGHFLKLAAQSNPSILEVLVSPVIEATYTGQQVQNLFPYLWSSDGVKNAFLGYSHSQRKKFLEEVDDTKRIWKYATAYARVLLLGIELLRYGTMTVNVEQQTSVLGRKDIGWFMPDYPGTDPGVSGCEGYIYEDLKTVFRDIKIGKWSRGHFIDWVTILESRLQDDYKSNPNKQTDMAKVNEFLLQTRRENW